MHLTLQANSTQAAPDILQGATVLMSDLHLRSADDATSRLFVAVTALLRRYDLHTLALLGDVFDFCLGNHPYFQKKFAFCAKTLKDCAARVLLLEGNHEFHLADSNWLPAEICTAFDYCLPLPDGGRVQLTHGDLLLPDRGYHLLRRLLKAQATGFLAARMPGKLLDSISAKVAELSRRRSSTHDCDAQRVQHYAAAWLDRCSADTGIFGHFHLPLVCRSPQGKLLLGLDAWTTPSFLIYKAGKFYRAYPAPDQIKIKEIQVVE